MKQHITSKQIRAAFPTKAKFYHDRDFTYDDKSIKLQVSGLYSSTSLTEAVEDAKMAESLYYAIIALGDYRVVVHRNLPVASGASSYASDVVAAFGHVHKVTTSHIATATSVEGSIRYELELIGNPGEAKFVWTSPGTDFRLELSGVITNQLAQQLPKIQTEAEVPTPSEATK